jgi:hypothetical protein
MTRSRGLGFATATLLLLVAGGSTAAGRSTSSTFDYYAPPPPATAIENAVTATATRKPAPRDPATDSTR